MKRSGWFLLCVLFWLSPTDGHALSPNPFHAGVARLGVLCRVQDSATGPEGTERADLPTAKVVGLAMVERLATALLSSKIVVERLPENSDALADPKTLVILLHGRIIALPAPTGSGTERLLLLSLALYRNQATDGGRSLFPAAPVAIPLGSGSDRGGTDGGGVWDGETSPARQALQKALTTLITAAGIPQVSPF
ncbi:MAG: hypothetical protein HQL87_11245 [Magnetococcales bacterium]|nr:hypothetical protein [Magnetococcales bacterium]